MKSSLFSKIRDIFLTLVAVFLIVSALIWFIHTFNVFELPKFIDDIFEKNTFSQESANEKEMDFLTLLQSDLEQNDDLNYVSLNKDKALQLLLSISPKDNFFWEVETELLFDNNSRIQLHKIYKQGEKVRVDTEENGFSTTTIFLDDAIVTFDNDSAEKSTFSGDTDFSYTNLINIAALEHSLKSDKIEVENVSIVELEGEKYLYAQLKKTDINTVDKYLVSFEYGVVVSSSSEIDGKQYFLQNTISFDMNSIISDEAFDVSDSTTQELLRHQ